MDLFRNLFPYDTNPPKWIARHPTEGKYLPNRNTGQVRTAYSKFETGSIGTIATSDPSGNRSVWLEITTGAGEAGCICVRILP